MSDLSWTQGKRVTVVFNANVHAISGLVVGGGEGFLLLDENDTRNAVVPLESICYLSIRKEQPR